MNPLAEIHSELNQDAPLLIEALLSPPEVSPPSPTDELQAEIDPQLRVGVEAIREGHLLHWGDGRVLNTPDLDLALLAGDRLYALGLERVAATGSRSAIASLSRLIKDSATAMARSEIAVAETFWTSTCASIGESEG
jgi:hypothetical protein